MEPDPHARRISQREIAKQLGVSHVTVSMALRNDPRVSEKVRKKVIQRAEELGYRPDPMLSALANYRLSKPDSSMHSGIAWINAWPDPNQLHSFKEFVCYWDGARDAAAKFGYRLEEFRMGSELSPQRLHQILSVRGIRGLLIPPHGYAVDWGDFPFEKYSLVSFGIATPVPQSHVVTADQFTNAMLAFAEIRKRGYRRIGFVTDESELTQDRHHFESGFLVAQRRVDETERVPVFALHGMPPPQRKKALYDWLKNHRVDAIFTTRNETRILLESAGVKVPEDVAMSATTILDINVEAGIDQHPEEIGRMGFLLLNSLINEGAKGIPEIPRRILVEGSWTNGVSLPDKNP